MIDAKKVFVDSIEDAGRRYMDETGIKSLSVEFSLNMDDRGIVVKIADYIRRK
jgi:hypothetical protein